jgi:integrase
MACVRKRRGRWIIDYYDQFGKRHWETVGTNKKEAEDRLAERMLGIRKGSYNPALSKTPLREYSEGWLEIYPQINNLKLSTVKSYRLSLTKYILPALGHLPLRSVTREAVKKLIGDLANQGLSRNTIRIIHATLRAVLNTAVEDGLLGMNPALRVGKFTKSKAERQREINPLSRQELGVLLQSVREHFAEHYPFFLTLARTGMRLGELLALQWGDIDFAGRLIEIKRSLVGGRIETPKNGKTRKVDMSSQLATELKNLLHRRKEETLRRGWRQVPEWVFCDRNGNPLDGNNLRKRIFYKAPGQGRVETRTDSRPASYVRISTDPEW